MCVSFTAFWLRQKSLTATWYSEHNKSKVTISFFRSEMIAKLELTQSTAQQNKDLTFADSLDQIRTDKAKSRAWSW